MQSLKDHAKDSRMESNVLNRSLSSMTNITLTAVWLPKLRKGRKEVGSKKAISAIN